MDLWIRFGHERDIGYNKMVSKIYLFWKSVLLKKNCLNYVIFTLSQFRTFTLSWKVTIIIFFREINI